MDMWLTRHFRSLQNVGKDLVLIDYRLTAENFVAFHGSPTYLSGTTRLQRQQQQTKFRRTAGLIVGHVGHLEVTKATERRKGPGPR